MTPLGRRLQLIERAYLLTLQHLNARFKSLAMRLTKWTGKSSVSIHPKHLIRLTAEHDWFTEFLEPGDVVLDVGCGSATHALKAARRCRLAVGFDCDGHQLTMGPRLATELGVRNLRLVKASAESGFPFADDAFDKVLFLDVIEHLHQRQAALSEIHRVLSDGGTMLLAAPNRETSWKRRLQAAGLFCYSDLDHKVEYSWDELCHELREGGFEPIAEPIPIVYDTPWAGLIDLTGGFSLALYRRLSRWKEDMARRHPEETTGWRVACARAEA